MHKEGSSSVEVTADAVEKSSAKMREVELSSKRMEDSVEVKREVSVKTSEAEQREKHVHD
jgi:hypothetical protein